MTTRASETRTPSDRITCGCCGQSRQASRVHELGDTPGVYICYQCALWAAGRMSKFPVVQLDPRRLPATRTAPGPSGRRGARGYPDHGQR